MTLDLAGRRCLITGGTRGLGRALAVVLARQGARVALTYSRSTSDAEQARAAVTAVGEAPLLFQGSVADGKHADAVVREVVAQWQGLDVLVHCAGIHQVLPIALLDESDWDQMMDVHVKGAYLFARAALRPMIRARAGSILFVGAFSSERIVDAPVHYAAAKSALRGLTESLAREVGRYQIAVNLLAPGLMDTGLGAMLPGYRLDEYKTMCPTGRLARAEEIAEFAAFLVSPANSFMAGAKVAVDGAL